MTSQGATATKEGRQLENSVEALLQRCGYLPIDDKKLKASMSKEGMDKPLNFMRDYYAGDPCYFAQIAAPNNIYSVPWKIDFLIWHPTAFPDGAILESKKQTVPGSVDEKYPFVVLSLKNNAPAKGILITTGGAIRGIVEDWLISQSDDDFLYANNEAKLKRILETGENKKSKEMGRIEEPAQDTLL